MALNNDKKILKGFWVLEGLDGAGTTTQLKNICNALSEKQIPYFQTAEPTDNPTGKFLRKVLSGEIKVQQDTIAHLFAADRNDHIFNDSYGVIRHLNNGEIVVSDRYLFSSFGYQGVGCSWDFIEKLNSDFPYPSHIIFIDTPPEDCLKRIESRGNAKEIYEKLDYQIKVKENYEKIFSSLPEGCTLLRIDGRLSKEEIFSQILKELL
ncbi:MAG: dTMP kinase [Sphaerochaetaceae bacterium]|nr:dTMP kinase [Sphaerochaetaceae bacterium]